MTIPKAITVFAGARDHYQLAIALAEDNLLESLITDIYFPRDKAWFEGTFGHLLSEDFLNKRYRENLPSQFVKVSRRAFLATIFQRFASPMRVNHYKDRVLGTKTGLYAKQTNSALFCYSYYAYHAFHSAGDYPMRFIFQVHPHPLSVRRILLDELERVPTARNSLMAEKELGDFDEQFEQFASAPSLANGWVVASSFCKNTLIEQGINADDIHVTPYGVDSSAFSKRAKPVELPFTIIFVGQMVQRKGLSDLLDAVRLLQSKHVRLLLCGRGYIDHNLLAQYPDVNFEVHKNLPFTSLLDKLHQSHIFVLPSLVEGFGHVIIEAMATGLPAITTANTGGYDVITDGIDGFIVPIRSAEAIAEKLTWAIEHPQALAEMGEAAHKRAKQQTWQSFRKQIRLAYKSMIANVT